MARAERLATWAAIAALAGLLVWVGGRVADAEAGVRVGFGAQRIQQTRTAWLGERVTRLERATPVRAGGR